MNYEMGGIGGARYALAGSGGTRRGRWVWIAVAAVTLTLALIGFFAFGKPAANKAADDAANAKQQIPTVTVTVPGRQSVERVVSATGSLAARIDMPVGVAGDGGVVTAVLVQPGQWVRAGQVLATVDRSVQDQNAAALAAQINVARADAELAEAELERARQLVGRGFISKADLDRKAATRDSAVARVRVAQATLGEAKARAARLAIRAPAAGLVLTRAVEPGQVVGPGSGTLFRIARDGELELRAAMAESDLTQIHVGSAASVTPVGGDRSFAGHIWQLSPVIDPQTRQGVARIALAYDPALRPGGFASATLMSGTNDLPQLPQSAVQSDTKGNFVYVVNARGMVVRTPVRVGQVSDAGVAITEGLTGRERVVVSAGAFLNPGQKVVPVLQKHQG